MCVLPFCAAGFEYQYMQQTGKQTAGKRKRKTAHFKMSGFL
jgi:hypothetical protein